MAARFNYKSPGPKYDAPTTIGYQNTDLRLPTAPAYSLGQLLQRRQTSQRVPGPKYDLSNVTRRGPVKAIGALLASKILVKHTAARTPGPAAYNTVSCMPVTMPAVPMCSIGMKRGAQKKFTATPAPNAYLVASTIGNRAIDLPSVPMYTISGRSEPGRGKKSTTFASPGPARYSTVRIEQFKKQTPRPVLLGRPREQHRSKQRVPAPNAYLPGPGSRYANAPQYSIAGRIPRQSDPYYTEADKVTNWE